MVHIGSAEYYAEVQRRLEACNVVVYEGVRSTRSWLLTRSYAVLTYRKRLGLVLQKKALIAPLAKKIHADLNAEQFATAWAAIPFWPRMLVLFCAPLYGIWLYFTATRRSIGRHLNTDEVESHRDFSGWHDVPELEAAIRTTRDRRLVDEVSAAVERSGGDTRIGILYGAAHMRVVSRLLALKYRYRVVESEWITVFDYPD